MPVARFVLRRLHTPVAEAQATDPAEEKLRIKMRAARRKMKGVNLQYVADKRVFFDDVAGIGEAKVRGGPPSPARPEQAS